MATVDYPPQLTSQAFMANRFSIEPGDNTILEQTDAGPPLGRARSTAAPDKLSGQIFLRDRQDYQVWTGFWRSVERHTSFNWVHPIERVVGEFRFAETPRIQSRGTGFVVDVEVYAL